MGPFDRAADQIEKAYENEEMTDKEYREELRGLREEQRDAAQDAYDDVMSGY